MLKSLLIVGAGGHGKMVAESALASGYDNIAFLDDDITKHETVIMGYPVIGSLSSATELLQQYTDTFVALGNNHLRMNVITQLEELGYTLPFLIHPSSTVSRFTKISSGTVVAAGVVIQPSSVIGKGCILNTRCSVDHDCVINDGVHISPGAVLCGTVMVGAYTWICAGAVISNNVNVGAESIVAAGAVAVEDVPAYCMVAGVPASSKKRLDSSI